MWCLLAKCNLCVGNVLKTNINSEFAESDLNSVETNFRIQFRISFQILISEFRLDVRIQISTFNKHLILNHVVTKGQNIQKIRSSSPKLSNQIDYLQ